MVYFKRIASLKDNLVETLRERGIEARYLHFGGPGDTPSRAPTVPTDSRSEFLANRAMGDWAENALAVAIEAQNPDWSVAHYGNSESIAAGEDGFRAFYLGGLDEVRQYGKRPDLLIGKRGAFPASDISTLSAAELDPIVKKAIAAIEVRSSKYEALKYMAARKLRREAGKKYERATPCFTVKVEDLIIAYRWLERHNVPQAYAQVFFDSVFAINFLDIFAIVGTGAGFTIEKPEKSQQKATIFIPITSGLRVGTFTSLPTFQARERVTALARHDAYVVPVGGDLALEMPSLEHVFFST
jgi:hypothetical protein